MASSKTRRDGPHPKVCGRCGIIYGEREWNALDEFGTMQRADVEPLVVGWRESTFIDLRRCRGCGVVLARLVAR
ncbi:hypothetical protein [Labilithrix luteola]|nr:hypothetical protein [Labilithrix luteola]